MSVPPLTTTHPRTGEVLFLVRHCVRVRVRVRVEVGAIGRAAGGEPRRVSKNKKRGKGEGARRCSARPVLTLQENIHTGTRQQAVRESAYFHQMQ